ncbi:MAG: MFS transporter [Chloroflexota bacterium]
MNRNINLYPWYVALFGATAWTPIFFLYFSQHLSLDQVLLLEAIYYASVVIIEVPSGYFSDVMGRRPTLLISTLAMGLSYLFFFSGTTFGIFAIAQVLLAIGFAFQSGTDTSFHFDSLARLGRTDEYGEREAIAGRNSLVARAAAIFLGGLAGLVSLRLGYLLSLLTMAGAFAIVLQFREPAQQDSDQEHADESHALREKTNEPSRTPQPLGPLTQLRLCLGYTRHPVLAWLMAYVILMTILDHVPYEFYQPYIELLGERGGFFAGRTPFISGIIMGLSTLIGAWAASRSIWLRDKLGLGGVLLLSVAIQTGSIAAMGLGLNVLVVLLVLLRTIPFAMANAPLRAAIAPLVPQAQRATYFSLQSLFGRLAFSGTLLILSTTTVGAAADWATLSSMLQSLALLGTVGLVGLLLTRHALTGS